MRSAFFCMQLRPHLWFLSKNNQIFVFSMAGRIADFLWILKNQGHFLLFGRQPINLFSIFEKIIQ